MKKDERIPKKLIPDSSIKRLILYRRCLEKMAADGIETVQSVDIGNKCGIFSSVIRKDLSYFGEFGTRGKGYNVKELIEGMDNAIFTKDEIVAILIGAGKLGQAILYHSEERCRVQFSAAFDRDPNKIGKSFNEVKVFSPDNMKNFVQKNKIKLAVIAIPCSEAQEAVNSLVNAGIKAILSLALAPVNVPDDVQISFMDVLPEVEFLNFKLKQRSII